MDQSLANAVLGSGSEFRMSATFLSWNTSTVYNVRMYTPYRICVLTFKNWSIGVYWKNSKYALS